jgi:hypothetical protein
MKSEECARYENFSLYDFILVILIFRTQRRKKIVEILEVQRLARVCGRTILLFKIGVCLV